VTPAPNARGRRLGRRLRADWGQRLGVLRCDLRGIAGR
jgi:hypothetical protein